MSVRKREWTTAKGESRTAWIVDYTDQQGTRRLKTFKKKKDADAYAARTSVDVSEGTHVADRATITVKEAGEHWITTGTNEGLERTTIDQRRQHLDLHIVPLIGRQKLSKISVQFVRAFQDRLREEGRSPAMVKRVTVSLGSLIADAQERGYVARNAVHEVSRSRKAQAKAKVAKRHIEPAVVGKDIPMPEEMATIIAAATGGWEKAFVHLAAFSGVRSSELRGLGWEHLSFEKRTINVARRADKYRKLDSPKTKAGRRTFPLPAMVFDALREWKLACPGGEHGLVLPNGLGNVEDHPNIIERVWKPLQVRAGVVDRKGNAKYSGLHSARHFFASWCINRKEDGGLGLPIKTVQYRMGHSSIQVTMDTYGHLFPTDESGDELATGATALMALAKRTEKAGNVRPLEIATRMRHVGKVA